MLLKAYSIRTTRVQSRRSPLQGIVVVFVQLIVLKN